MWAPGHYFLVLLNVLVLSLNLSKGGFQPKGPQEQPPNYWYAVGTSQVSLVIPLSQGQWEASEWAQLSNSGTSMPTLG